MKKQIAKVFMSIAKWFDQNVEEKEGYVARQVGIGIHISKKDVRNFRVHNPNFKSHREGLNALIEDVKDKALMNILYGLKRNHVVEYEVKRSFWTADVKAILKVYVPAKKAE